MTNLDRLNADPPLFVSIVTIAGDAADGEVEYIRVGQDVEYTYTVTNRSKTYLNNIEITDDVLGIVCYVHKSHLNLVDPLHVCKQYLLSLMNVIIIGTVTANPCDKLGNDIPGMDDRSAADEAEVRVVDPRISIENQYIWDREVIEYTVTNTGDTYLNNIFVTDDMFGLACSWSLAESRTRRVCYMYKRHSNTQDWSKYRNCNCQS